MDAKHLQSSRSLLRPRGLKKLQGNCLFGLRLVSEPHEKAGSFPLPQVRHVPSRSLLMYSELTQLKDRSSANMGNYITWVKNPFVESQLRVTLPVCLVPSERAGNPSGCNESTMPASLSPPLLHTHTLGPGIPSRQQGVSIPWAVQMHLASWPLCQVHLALQKKDSNMGCYQAFMAS